MGEARPAQPRSPRRTRIGVWLVRNAEGVVDRANPELLHVEDAVWVLHAPTGVPIYDFAFDRLLACRRPYQPPGELRAVARVGAIADYDERYTRWLADGVRLVHSPDEHRRASELSAWYPLLADITPKSIWGREPPDLRTVASELGWPVFVKGSRQTSRHRRSLSIVEGPEAYARVLEEYARDSILHWQDIVCRRYVRLRPVEDVAADRVPSSFEFRTFWWRGELVGFGRYWWEGKAYEPTAEERAQAVAVAGEAARRVNVTFLVVDVAQAADGTWLVIECNDGQESGYAGVSPVGLWQALIAAERRSSGPG